MTILSHEDIKSFIETQLALWPMAKANYDNLARAERKEISIGDLQGAIQYNPARIRSTGAKVDAKSISERPCFLCRGNRPQEQLVYDIAPGWEMLVNPFPILPVHLTIVSSSHVPQASVPEDIVSIVESLPGMVVFFNGAKAGASAPDHLHLQAVMKDELPLIRLVERIHNSDCSGIVTSAVLGRDLPFYFVSGIVMPDTDGVKCLAAAFHIGGKGISGKLDNPELVNAFFWIDQVGRLRYIVVPRQAHRPQCYFKEGKGNHMVSPGCIDMAGLIITPRKEDFDTLSPDDILGIYSDVALPQDYE